VLTRDEVIWAFRYCLGRDPESEETVLRHTSFSGWLDLRNALMASDEFHASVGFRPFPSKWVMCTTLGDQRKMWVDLSDRYVSIACMLDQYEPDETLFLRKHLRKGQGFVDVGANVGWFTMVASTILDPSDPITAFEPRRSTSEHLQMSIEENGLAAQATLHRCGLSDHEGNAFINNIIGTDNPGGSFISPDKLGGQMESQAISVRTLDSFRLDAVGFVKMDVEGAEPQVVAGAMDTLSRCRPVVMSEINPIGLRNVSGASVDDYLKIFIDMNYRIEIIGNGRDGEIITRFPSDWTRDIMNVGMVPQ
jgi:FkbM family methyltransferase